MAPERRKPKCLDPGCGQQRTPKSRADTDRNQTGLENCGHKDERQANTLSLGFAGHADGRQFKPHAAHIPQREGNAGRLCAHTPQTTQAVPPAHEIAPGKKRVHTLPARAFRHPPRRRNRLRLHAAQAFARGRIHRGLPQPEARRRCRRLYGPRLLRERDSVKNY